MQKICLIGLLVFHVFGAGANFAQMQPKWLPSFAVDDDRDEIIDFRM